MQPNTAPMHRLFMRLPLLLAATLAACGGGDDTGNGLADKYVGVWASPCTDLSAALGRPNSYKTLLTLKKTADAAYSSEGGNTEWANATCAGGGTPILGESGTTVFTIVGTKVVGSDTVDKLNFGAAPSLRKSISMVSADGRSLRLGSDASVFDADGYPSTLYPTVYTKQ